MREDRILLAHGAGGLMSSELIKEAFLPYLENPWLSELEDSAVLDLDLKKDQISLTTDSYVVNPLFFPGGDIGSLAIHGTVNDLAMNGATPLYLSAGFIIEEGMSKQELSCIVQSMANAAQEARVSVVAGDTKVVAKGAADKLYINTSGIGVLNYPEKVNYSQITPEDSIIVNGTLGDHGATILNARENVQSNSKLKSDSAPLNTLVENILQNNSGVHCMRDATRGGLGAVLVELANQRGACLEIDEQSLPVKEEVKALCEIMGLDPLYIANEGKVVLFCAREVEQDILQTMRACPTGQDAAVIGRVQHTQEPRVKMQTLLGTHRDIDLPSGEIVPRIC